MEWSKHPISWEWGGALYVSVVFSWQLAEAEAVLKSHDGPISIGGPAHALANGYNHLNGCDFDALSMHNPLATFTTRGCIRSCPFCAVPKLEGEFREIENFKVAPLVCDNNFLAASRRHKARVIDRLRRFDYVDFNQGLDARLFRDDDADLLSDLRGVKVRFSLDHSNQEGHVKDAIDLARAHGFRDFGVYVLIGFNDTPDDARHRLELVRSWGIKPNPMRYQPLDSLIKNSYVAPGWTDYELKRTMRYYSRLAYLNGIPFDDYQTAVNDLPLFDYIGEGREENEGRREEDR